MAWKISKAKRQALVKLQLRDKKGRWIEMGGGVKWYSSRLKKQVSGTVVGTKGENALVRLDKQEGQDRSPLVSVAARNITVIDEKASLAPTTMGTPTDKTSEFEGAIPVANESNGAPKSNGYVKPSDSPEDYQVTETADGRAYIGRNDGAELYFPARSLEVGDVLMAPEGGDETKPFSIGKGWAKKGVESVNTKGPKTGTVIRIEGDRYAVVQLPDGFTVPDKKHEGEQTDLVTVGLSNSVIKLTDGMQSALGEHISATFDGNADEQEVDDSEEENSDHVGREVPEEEVAAEERDPADVDLTDITDGEEEEKAAPITEKAREIEIPQADNSGSDDQTLNENGLTDDEQKLVKAFDRMAQRAYDQGNVENGATYEANANRLRKLGEDRRAGAKADHENTDDTPQKDPQEAERQQKAAEPTPKPESAPEAAPEAQEETPAPNLEEPDKKNPVEAATFKRGMVVTLKKTGQKRFVEVATKYDGERESVNARNLKDGKPFGKSFTLPADDYYLPGEEPDAIDTAKPSADTAEAPAAPNLEEPDTKQTASTKELFPKNSLATLKKTGKQRQVIAVVDSFEDGKERIYSRNLKEGKPFGKTYTNFPEEFEAPKNDPYRPENAKLPGREGTYTDGADYEANELSREDVAKLPVGTTIYGTDEEDPLQFRKYVKIGDNEWLDERDKVVDDLTMAESDGWNQAIFLPDNERNPVAAEEVARLSERFANGKHRAADDAWDEAMKAKPAWDESMREDSKSDAENAAERERLEADQAETERLEAEDRAAVEEDSEAAPKPAISSPERYAEAERSWDSDQERIDAEEFVPGKGMPTLFKQSVRGNARTALEDADESARESEYDQGYRMVDGKIEVHDFDRADSSLEDNLGRWYDLQQSFPTKEFPNRGGYTGGYTKAKVNSVVNGLEKLREAVRAAKADHDAKQGEESTTTNEGLNGTESGTPANGRSVQEPSDRDGGSDNDPTSGPEGDGRELTQEEVDALPDDAIIHRDGAALAKNDEGEWYPVAHFLETGEKDGLPSDMLDGGVTQPEGRKYGEDEFVPALNHYIKNSFKSVNDYIRNGNDPESATPGFTDTVIDVMDDAIANSPLPEDTTFFRGLQISAAEAEKFTAGSIISDKGFTSVSADKDIAGTFAHQSSRMTGVPGPENPVPVVLEVNLPKGHNALAVDYSKVENESWSMQQESVLGRDSAFKVDSVEVDDNYGNKLYTLKVSPTSLDEQPQLDSNSTVDGEPDAAVVSHLNENAVLGNDDERRAAGLYLGGARYNDALRSGNVPEMLQEQIDTLAGFIDKQPEFGQETKLYRGGQPLGDVDNRIGEVITEPAFMSTSLKRSEAEIFAGSGPVMEITARPQDKALSINAAYMTDQSDIPEEYRQPVDVTAREAEMLLKPSTSFEITGVREENGRKVVEARIVDSPESSPVESQEAAPELDENGLTPEEARQLEIAREEDYLGGIADKDPESRPYYQKPIDDLLEKGRKRLAGEDVDTPEESPEDGSYTAESGHTVYTESAPGRVPDLKATAQAVKESGVESVHVPISDAPKKDYTPEELENSFDRREKTGLTDSVFDALPKEYQRFKDQDAPADPINLPEDEEDATETPESGDRFANLQPTAEEQAQLDEFDKAMDDAVASDDVDAYDVASDAKYDLMEAIADRNAEEPASESEETEQETTEEPSTETTEDSEAESTEESEDTVHPLDALGIKRRTPEAVAGEAYAPTQQQQDVIDAVLGGLDTKVQAMAGTGKTSTLVALSRRIAEQGGQAVYIAFNKTVQEEAVRRMEGLPVEPKTGHAVAHTWAKKNMPHLTIRLGGNDPTRVTATYDNGKPKAYAKKRAWTSARAVGDALGIEAGAVKEEGSGIPKSKSNIVLAVKKTVEKFALSDSDTIQTSHVPEVFEIAESDLPKIVDFANDYWDDLKREDGNFRVTHDVYRKFWALSKPDLTDGTGGTKKGANILYIDEAQDTPPVLAKVVADQKMQKVIVGDANQAIYAFAENIDYLSEADGDIELPLNKSWRFGPEVADAGNRFLQMLGSENRVVGGGGPSKITYDMEDADAVLVRTNAGMIQAILEETKRDRRVTAPDGTRSNLESLVESVESLKEGYEPEHPHDDLIGYKNWDQVKAAWKSGDRNLNMIVKLFDVVDNYSLSRLKPEQIEEEVARKMADAKKAIDHLVIDVPGFNTVKMVQRDGRTYLEPVDENPYPVDEKGKQKAWGWKEKQYAVSNFSAKLGETRKPWLKDNNLDFGPQQMEYRKKGGLEDVGWTYERGEYFTEDEDAIKRFATYGGQYDVTISTAHKSKGLEWDRVRIGWDFIGPREDPKTGAMIWPEDDEYKLGYVALTRAAKEIDPGSLDYVFQYTQPNGGDPKAGKGNVTVPEDTTPEPEQVADEPPVDVTPDTEKEADDALVFADPEFTPVPETRETPETTPEPEVEEAPEEVAPEVVPDEAPVYDDLTGLTAEEEAYKDSLIEQAKLMSRAKRWSDHQRLVKEYNAMFDKGRERLKLQKQQTKAEEVAPEPVETPEPAAPTTAPETPTAPEFNEDGLTPEEAARVANLEKWINDVYTGYGQGNVKKMENELDDLYKRGEKRQNGEPDAEAPIDTTPEFETPAPVSLNPEVEPEAPSPVDGVPVVKPMKKSVPTGRRRGQSTVPDADGGEIKVGDTIKHKKFGDVVVTGVLPGAGRVTFISPKTGKESSVKGDAVSLSKETPPAVAEAAGTRLTGTPGDRVMDPITGKKAFIGADGTMIVTGERVRDIKTGQIGIVQTVYTGADKKASVPVLFPGEKEPRRVRGTQLSHADSGGSEAPETEPIIPEAPEPAPEAPKAPEPAPEAPEAPEPEAAPEVAPTPVVDEKTERRRAAIGNAPEGAEVRSKDGGEVYTKITSDVWENTDASDSMTDDEVLEKILNGEGDGKGYIIRTPSPAPVPEPEPEPEPEVIPEPDTSLSGQELADTITYESTLHMTDGDLADMMARYADDAIVFDKIMEVMDERDANVFLPVDTSKSGATLDDQPALFDMTVPDPTAKTERKLTPAQRASEEYQNYVMSQYNKALEELNGVLLNDAGKAYARGAGGSDLEINLFSGSAAIARKYASEELLQWWMENGRETLASFRYRMYGWEQDRKAAQTVRSLGYERGQIARDRSNI